MNNPDILIPSVSDEDINWVENLMNLELDDERIAFLKCNTSVNINACPGSGKTTLVVAKLAILLRKWKYKSKGICVLSHTNVAREEIESRLGNTPEGQALLSYPHFVGTIHSFASKFLVAPYMKSKHIDNIVVDDNLTIQKRRALFRYAYYEMNTYLQREHSSLDEIKITSIEPFQYLHGKRSIALNINYSRKIVEVLKSSLRSGFLRYSEVFVLGNYILDKHHDVSTTLQNRFPYVLLDEMQDTDGSQWETLNKIFKKNENHTFQTVGDYNQAIYHSTTIQEEEQEEEQGNSSTNMSISNSFRFCNNIASLANKSAITPLVLTGKGPQFFDALTTSQNTIFIFPQNESSKVLPAFGELLLSSFTDEQLRSKHKIYAVGGVHRHKEEDCKENHLPKSVIHYWQDYNPNNLNKKDYNPDTLLEYFYIAKDLFQNEKDSLGAFNKLASGIYRLISLVEQDLKIPHFPHKKLLDLLENNNVISKEYKIFCLDFFLSQNVFDEPNWEDTKQKLFIILGEEIISSESLSNKEVTSFLAWERTTSIEQENFTDNYKKINCYQHIQGEREVEINLSSIHGVKGQTHLATLVLDTYSRTHFFKQLLPIIATGKVDKKQLARMKQCYVAMTRPTHLLCLAVAESSLPIPTTWEKHKSELEELGWKIKNL